MAVTIINYDSKTRNIIVAYDGINGVEHAHRFSSEHYATLFCNGLNNKQIDYKLIKLAI